ncbi:hypothetical protein [Marinirhabdus gelatinilytica]|uniref:Uncharacterized protein n=1 Tax=Marinirhabdus gelatinilytica TaxID=1703343 RepID=A0A370QK42_9FLAO|nr:hypothetical protein [Marinirhabdus gelatinilytica]RDK88722.1 hypothetical protein C8D94_101599 [Marinirhabdus gelatinilytica]
MKIITLLYSSIFLCASFCCDPDDDGLLFFDADVPDLASVQDNATQFNVGDTLWVQVSVPKVVEVNGDSRDISEIAGNSQLAHTNFRVFQENGFDNPAPIIFSENELVSSVGSVSVSNQYIQASAYLQGDFFNSTFGIILKEAGDYYITGDEVRNGVLLISVETSTNIVVTIYSNIVNANTENNYPFAVE